MFYRLGRILQLLGLLILPAAIAGEMAERLTLKESLTMTGVGISVFFIGWLLQQNKRP